MVGKAVHGAGPFFAFYFFVFALLEESIDYSFIFGSSLSFFLSFFLFVASADISGGFQALWIRAAVWPSSWERLPQMGRCINSKAWLDRCSHQ